MAWLCYGLLVGAWILDLFTPQALVAAILLNGPIALSSLALRSRLTTQLVVAAEVANVVAGYVNGVQAGYHWDGIAIGDRLLAAASFVLVGYLSVKTQQYAREAGLSLGRMRQIQIEKALAEATGGVRETLNLELVRRAILRESISLMNASSAILVVRGSASALPLLMTLCAGESEPTIDRRALSAELASLTARARDQQGVVRVTRDDAFGRLMLDALGAGSALVTAISAAAQDSEYALVALVAEPGDFSGDAAQVLQAFAHQAAIALAQSALFTQLGERNDEIARQRNELGRRSDVIRDIVYALAHDLRTPLAAAEVTMKQALDGAYGQLPERYRGILGTSLAANEEERRLVETLLLVARYEAGEESHLRELVDVDGLLSRVTDEMRPLAEAGGVRLDAEDDACSSVEGDSTELRRALLNLLANAIAATPRGGAVIVRTRAEGDAVTIEVEDDGHGVPPERRDSLFARFGGGRTGGTGLGLYIVKRIVEKHGGSATFEPREPSGSIFRLSLPKGPAA